MKYLQLFENFIYESVNNIPLQWSKDFERVLKSIKHPLAKKLLDRRLDSESITLLDITLDGDFISYVPADKVLKRLNIEDWDKALTLIKPLTISSSEIYNTNSVKTRTGRVFRKLLPTATSKEIEDLTNEFKSKFTSKKWSMLGGSDINDGYHSANYYQSHSSNILMNSCMNDQSILIEFYAYCPVKLLVLSDEDSYILGRALVWKFEGGYLMDRVYTIYDKDYYSFIEYAKSNGWWWKTENKSSAEIPYTNGTETKWFPIRVRVPHISEYEEGYGDDYYGYPYMDTLCYAYNNILSNQPPSENDKSTNYLILNDTEGYPEVVESIFDVYGNPVRDPDDYGWSNTQGGLVSLESGIYVDYGDFSDFIDLKYLRQKVNGFVQNEGGEWFRLKDCQILDTGEIIFPS